MSEDYDYSKFRDEPEDSLIKQIAKLAKEQLELKVKLEEKEKEAAELKEKLKHNIEFALPELFDKGGLEGTITTNGLKIPLVETIRASVSKENFEAFKWLQDNGQARLVKSKFIIEFDPLDPEWSKDFQTLLESKGIDFKRERSVHASSLSSAVTQMMKDGVEVPQKTLNVWRQRTCKVK